MASNLAIYSGNRIAMTIGDGGEPWLQLATYWASFLIQPWVIAAVWAESVSGHYAIHMSIGSTVITGIVSAVILSWFLAGAIRRFPKLWWLTVPLLLALGVHSGLVYHQQMSTLANLQSFGAP